MSATIPNSRAPLIEVDAAEHGVRTPVLRRAQDQLRQRDAARQTAILNALPAHIALLDDQGLIISVNEVWRQFGSASVTQAPGHRVGLNYPEICDRARGDDSSEARRVAAGIRSVLGGAVKTFSIEYACHSPTEQRWFLMTVTSLGDDRPHGAVVMHMNVTERKRAEDKQREVRQLLDNIVENIPTAVQLKSVQDDFRIVMWNKAAEAMYGLPRDSAIGRNVHDLWPESDADRMHAADLGLVSTKRMQDFPDRVAQTADRGDIRVHMRKAALCDAGGNATHLLVIADDMTTQLVDQARLRESESRFRSLTELSSDWYWEQDEKHRFVSFSGGDRDGGWGADQSRALGLHRWELPGVVPVSGSWNEHKALLEARKPFRNFEYQRIVGGGTLQYVAASGEPVFDASGRFTGYRGVATDITERKRAEHELQRFRAAMDISGDAIVLIDRASMRYIDVNQTLCDMAGHTRQEVLGMTPMDLLGTGRETLERDYDAIIADNNSAANRIEGQYRRKDGSLMRIETRRRALHTENGWIIVGTVRDITAYKEAEAKIIRLNRVHAVLSGINTAIVRIRERDELFGETCRIAVSEGGFIVARVLELDSNGRACIAATTESDSRLYQRLLDDYNSDPEHCSNLIALALRSGRPLISNDVANDPRIRDRAALTKEGNYAVALLPMIVEKRVAGAVVLRAREAGMFDEDELRLLLEVVSNLSFALELMDQRQQLDYLAYYDALTGLANRRLFLERVAQYMRSAVRGGHKLAVMLIDLERFKNINDSLGRPAGDALLKQVAEWLTRNGGDANLLARLGADHFAAVLPVVRQDGDVARLLEKTMNAFLEHPFRLNDAVFRINVKVGVALFPDDGADADTLFTNAEAALKKAKGRGERFLFYTQKMTEKVAGKLTLENQLRQAHDKGEFVLHFQPKVNLESGKLTGVEALIRWNDPRTGLVPPGRFIPVLEETGLIHDVGRWALRKAVEDYLRWRAAGLPAVRIAVNVSPLQLRDRGFIAEIEQAIGIDTHAAAGLELEITESLIMEDVKHSIASLQAIRAMGVTIAIDDFGTGFSSLSYLAKLPVDTLKIDRSFVTGMTSGPEGLALVSTVISLAHALKLNVVAEGVETEEQSRLLLLLNCDEMQGFLFSKPVPVEIFEARFLAPAAAP